MSDELIFETADGVAILRINRPEVRNAIDGATARAIAAAIDELDERDDLSVGVITGAGGTFCSGMDLRGFLAGDRPSIEGRGFAGLVQAPPRKPLIAAVEGYALAGGCEIALACDIIVASEKATFGLPEPKRGLVPTGGGALKLHKRLPYHVAMELLLTGKMFPAERAHHFGFVNHLVPEGTALEAALALAREIAANAPLALEAIKQVVLQSQDWSQAESHTLQTTLTAHVFRSADAREGSRAFAEKRPPVWTRS
ncbi:crotonase/enoyl-CoA hydratase family protein [Actinocorallia aurantiaca]|uniref:Crotonase/enoyl-CoA hydratase family protein n=1 Tax=Actinocorallia aurantiaca TaxID=46204 RepID=A0ABN3UR17_9ACTN